MMRRGFASAGLAAACLLLPGVAQANPITVATTSDTSPTVCTLRDAITAANNNVATNGCVAGSASGVDVIGFSPAFSSPPVHNINLNTALPNISSDLQIQGPAADLLNVHRAAVGPFRIFTLASGAVTISGLTVSGGLADGTTVLDGGGIDNSGTLSLSGVTVSGNTVHGSAGGLADGGGIMNDGTLHIDRSTISGNTVDASATGMGTRVATGGGIDNNNVLTIDRSTIANNQAIAGVGAADQFGAARAGGIENDGGALTIDRSTIDANTVTATGGSSAARADGAGIRSQFNSSVLIVRRSQITGNTLTAGGDSTENDAFGGGVDATEGGITLDRLTLSANSISATGAGTVIGGGGLMVDPGFRVTSSTLTGNSAPAGSSSNAQNAIFKNTIVSNPLGGGVNCAGTTSGGFNIEDGTTCGFSQVGDHQSTNPMLAATLASNGGPTETFALQAGSPAIDAGLSSAGETTDQRELQRPFDWASIPNAAGGDGTDIGSYEVEGTCDQQAGGCPVSPAAPAGAPAAAPTGQRAAALKKCKKKRTRHKRRKCRKRAKKLPV